jgi:rare lipoprotein A
MNRTVRLLALAVLLFAGSAKGQMGRPEPPGAPPVENGTAVVWPHLPGERRMASGGVYRPDEWVVAHPSLPLGLRLVLSDERGERSAVVTVADRASDLRTGAMLVSDAAAEVLGIREDDTRRVRIRRLGPGDPAAPGIWRPGDGTRAADSGAQWAVQLGSFAERRWADRFADRLDGARVERLRVDGHTVYRVYFGRFADRADAEAWRERLAGWGIDGFVKSLDDRR